MPWLVSTIYLAQGGVARSLRGPAPAIALVRSGGYAEDRSLERLHDGLDFHRLERWGGSGDCVAAGVGPEDGALAVGKHGDYRLAEGASHVRY
jgi:hypothetical protein